MDAGKEKLGMSGLYWLPLLLLFHLFFSDAVYRFSFFYRSFLPWLDGAGFTAYCLAWVASTWVYLLGIAAALKIFRLPTAAAGWLRPASLTREAAIGASAGAAGLLLSFTALNSVLHRVQAGSWKLLPFLVNDSRVGFSYDFAIFGSLIAWSVGPVVEELAYRGVIYTETERRWGGTSALLVSSVLFALSHLNFFGESFLMASPAANLNMFIRVLFSGLVLGLLRRIRGSLAAPIAAHAVWNMGINLAAALGGR